jgi:salicylate hydroxylase
MASVKNQTRQRVMIVGGGLGGATLALALLQRGFTVKVYEQAPALTEQGAGLTLPPSSMRVFNALGVWEAVRDITVKQDGGSYVHYKTGEILSYKPDYDWVKKPQKPDESGHSHRGAVHMVLVRAIRELAPDTFAPGHRLKGLTQTDTGVVAEFENGVSADGDIVVGCDGLHSVTHKILFGERKPRFTGVVAMRTMIPVTERVKPYLSGGRFLNYVGPTASFLRYGVMGGTLLNCVALVKTDRWQTEGWENKSSRAEFLEIFGDFHPDLVGLIENAPEDSFFKWALYDRDPLEAWSKGRVTLLGDAAHPMLPYLGHGATTAIEDGLVLARCLEAYGDHGDAFRAYETARRDRTAKIMLASRAQGEAMTQSDPRRYDELRVDLGELRNYDAATAPI